MARGGRPGIRNSSPEMDGIIDAMKACHKAIARVRIKPKIGGPACKKATAVSDALHDLAEELTGDRSKLLKG